MSNVSSKEQLDELVFRYVYGDLTHAEKSSFEQMLEEDPGLQKLLDEELKFQNFLPPGTAPQIDNERLTGNRFLLHKNLRGMQEQGTGVQRWWQSLVARPQMLGWQLTGMAITFVLGLLVTNLSMLPAQTDTVLARVSSPLALVNEQDYQVASLQINSYDESTGEIDLSFSLVSDTTVQANIADANIRRLMTVALEDEVDSAVRLQAVAALGKVNELRDVYQTMIYLLTSDQNPGVRYQAVSLLVEMAGEDEVRDALRLALQRDVNSGVRLEAFNALAQYPEAETLAVFRDSMTSDNNEYIRTRARAIVENPQAERSEI